MSRLIRCKYGNDSMSCRCDWEAPEDQIPSLQCVDEVLDKLIRREKKQRHNFSQRGSRRYKRRLNGRLAPRTDTVQDLFELTETLSRPCPYGCRNSTHTHLNPGRTQLSASGNPRCPVTAKEWKYESHKAPPAGDPLPEAGETYIIGRPDPWYGGIDDGESSSLPEAVGRQK